MLRGIEEPGGSRGVLYASLHEIPVGIISAVDRSSGSRFSGVPLRLPLLVLKLQAGLIASRPLFFIDLRGNLFNHGPRRFSLDGGIGRRKGLKIPRLQGRAGSIPAPGTFYGESRPLGRGSLSFFAPFRPRYKRLFLPRVRKSTCKEKLNTIQNNARLPVNYQIWTNKG